MAATTCGFWSADFEVNARTTSEAISRLHTGEILTRGEVMAAFKPVLDHAFTGADVAWGALLAALHSRGPTSDEMLGLVDAIAAFDQDLNRQLTEKLTIDTDFPVVAITGSGKESFKTFNVSTAAALIAAAHPGVCVIKPAGRATSATTGASDVLEALGVKLPSSLNQVATMAHRCRLGVFDYHLVAPRYGPRYEGKFHHLHPLSHVTPWLFVPIRVDGVVFGVAEPRVELAASVMGAAGIGRAAVVTTSLGQPGRIDEYAPFGEAHTASLTNGALHVEAAQQAPPTGEQLTTLRQRASHAGNAAVVLDILSGNAAPSATTLASANAALIFQVAGVAADLVTGIETAHALIDSGEALAHLEVCRKTSREMPFTSGRL